MLFLFLHLVTEVQCNGNIASQVCQLAQAVKGSADDLVKGAVDQNIINEVKHILEMVLLLVKKFHFMANCTFRCTCSISVPSFFEMLMFWMH